MSPNTREKLVMGVFTIAAFFLAALITLSFAGCTHVPVSPSATSPHAAVDAALSDARQTQQQAAAQVSNIVRSVSDPATRRSVEDLQKTINDLGLKLETATGKISWYEAQYDLVIGQRDWWQNEDTKDKAARVQTEKERDALIWIFSMGCGVTAVAAFRPVLSTITGLKQLLFIAAAFIGGFALGFSIGRWALRFLAEFTPHLPF